MILDVVYNHTAEGSHLGPVLSFKGIDNAAYYRLGDEERYYFDTTGTGNTLNMRHPNVLQMIIASLRYWVGEMHVDGFRFDLAASLARQFHEVDRLSAFFDLIQADPVVSQVKLIAEPWDLGDGGYKFLVLFNAHHEEVMFVLPGAPWGERWVLDFDTAIVPASAEPQVAGAKIAVPARSVQVLRRV